MRLRKYQWTENVPVQHEEVRVEQEAAETATRIEREDDRTTTRTQAQRPSNA